MGFTLPDKTELSKLQNQIIKVLASNASDRYAVIGGPGTGKTVLALQQIIDVINDPKMKNICFLVYSKPLSNLIYNNIKKQKPKKTIKAATFNSWLFTLLLDINGKNRSKQNWSSNDEFIRKTYQNGKAHEYDYEKVIKDIKNALDSGKIQKYDVLVVDEAQDVSQGMLKTIDMIANRIYIYFDENQMVGNDKETIDNTATSILNQLDLCENFFDLTDNYRNTKEIEAVAKLFGENYATNQVTLMSSTAMRESKTKPYLIDCGSVEKICKMVVKRFKQNINKSFAVLIPKCQKGYQQEELYNEYKKCFENQEEIKGKFYAYFGNDRDRETHISGEEAGIYLMSYRVSKGLEFDEVLLVELNNPNASYANQESKNQLYVAITRARNNVSFIWDSTKAANEITNIINTNLELFEKKKVDEFETNILRWF